MFSARNLSVLAYANSFTLWHYKAYNEASADVLVDGYFDDAAELFAAGDVVLIGASDGGAMRRVVSAGAAPVVLEALL